MVSTRPPRTAPPITNITLPCPWSVPWLAFSRATRPNSETATTVTRPMRFAPFMSA